MGTPPALHLPGPGDGPLPILPPRSSRSVAILGSARDEATGAVRRSHPLAGRRARESAPRHERVPGIARKGLGEAEHTDALALSYAARLPMSYAIGGDTMPWTGWSPRG